MQRSLVSMLATAVAALLISGGVARAEEFPWSYTGNGPTIYNSNNASKSSDIKFLGTSGGATGDSGIIIYNLQTESTAPLESPDSFSKVPYALDLTLGDTKSLGKSTSTGVMKFTGNFSASKVSKDSFLSPVNVFTSPTSQSVVLGSDATGWRKYQVDILSFTPPGKPGAGLGSIYAEVHITPTTKPTGAGDDTGNNPPPTANTPEPASLVLAGLGLPLVGVYYRRRKNRAQSN